MQNLREVIDRVVYVERPFFRANRMQDGTVSGIDMVALASKVPPEIFRQYIEDSRILRASLLGKSRE